MFTGIIETKSNVIDHKTVDGLLELTLARPNGWDIVRGQSIACDGVCLTVETFDEQSFMVKLMPETLNKSTYGGSIPAEVNLERAMLANGRFEGHVVQGHVDCAGSVSNITSAEGWTTITISHDHSFDKLVVPKGSIAINGVSLTVVDPAPGQLSVALIPHTLEITTLGTLSTDQTVNLEFDILGKYILNRA